jgi:hypothetical protein
MVRNTHAMCALRTTTRRGKPDALDAERDCVLPSWSVQADWNAPTVVGV